MRVFMIDVMFIELVFAWDRCILEFQDCARKSGLSLTPRVICRVRRGCREPMWLQRTRAEGTAPRACVLECKLVLEMSGVCFVV